MNLFKKKPPAQTLTRTEALSCIPHRSSTVIWSELGNGDVLIEYKLNLKPFFIEIIRKFTKTPQRDLTKKLQLDSMGSSVWHMLDGQQNIKTIIEVVSAESGLPLAEAEISVTKFLRELGRRGILLIG